MQTDQPPRAIPPSVARSLAQPDLLELIDHLKGTGPRSGRFPEPWFGTLSHLRRREIRALLTGEGPAS